MPNLILPARFTSQPQYAAPIDWSNPLSQGLVFAFNAANPAVNAVTNSFYAGDNFTALGQVIGPNGKAANAGASSAQFRWWTGISTGTTYTVCSVLWDSARGSTDVSPFAMFAGAGNNVFFLRLNANTPSFRAYDTAGSNADAVSSTTTPADRMTVLVGVLDSSKTATIYMDGISRGTASGLATPETLTVGRKLTLELDEALALGKFAGYNYANFAWTRALRREEIVSLSQNPWQLFKMSSRTIFAQGATSGIQFDAASNSGYQVAQTTYTFNRTVSGANTFLAVDIPILSAGQTVTGVIDDSAGGAVPMKFIGARSTVTSFGRIESWGLAAPAAGTKSIQITLSGSVTSAGLATSYTGVNQSFPQEGYQSAQATNVGAADATVNVTTISDNSWVHAAVATDDGSITANQTSRNNVSGGAANSGANEDTGPKTPAGAVTMSYTGVGALATWAIGAYVIRPLAADSPAGYSQGASTAVAVGSRLISGDAYSQGTSTSIAVGTSRVSSDAYSAGVSTAIGVGQSSISADAFSQGASTAVAVGSSIVGTQSDAYSAGVSTAIATGANIVAAAGYSAGASTAKAVGSGGRSASTIITLGAKNPWAPKHKPIDIEQENEELLALMAEILPHLAQGNHYASHAR